MIFCAVYFETTDIAVASKPFYSDMWKGFSFMSPNLKELQEISKNLTGKHCHILIKFFKLIFKYMCTIEDELWAHILNAT